MWIKKSLKSSGKLARGAATAWGKAGHGLVSAEQLLCTSLVLYMYKYICLSMLVS